MLVAFWGPVQGQTRTTSNMVASATSIALDYPLRVLMTHTKYERSMLESAYTLLKENAIVSPLIVGMDGIDRLVQCGMLTAEGIRDHAESILKDRLDLISGPKNQDDTNFKQVLHQLFENYKRFYDLVFIDISSGTSQEISQLVMQHADLIVVNLNQNKVVLDNFFANNDWSAVGETKKLLYCFGSYHQTSRMSLDRMARTFPISKKKCAYVPHNLSFMDAQNDQQVVQFMLKARSVKKKFLEYSEEVHFTESVRTLAAKIIDSLDLYVVAEELLND
ncbi:hypothetical protein ACFP56_14885 [Paenibacillus septentrionalis]|uniref:ParA family protein n=1 Tax=Paenibacillus septentrionalis TaxID=429342 RepID=A0ABW1V941_9BACL